jgi:hypothetical protein
MIGDPVKNMQGEDLGKIEELMIDRDSGRVAYAVLSFGGVLGLGDKLFAIPWDALRLSTEEKAFFLDVDKEQLKNAPGFDKDNWPGTNGGNDTDGWLVEVYEYYGYEPYWR